MAALDAEDWQLLPGGAGRRIAGRAARAFSLVQVAPEPRQRAVERDFDGVRLQAEDLPDLPRREVGAVAQRQEIARAIIEHVDGGGERHAPHDVDFEVFCRGNLGRLRERRSYPRSPSIVDAASCDTEKPLQRLSARLVITRAIPQSSLEDLARHVFGIRPVTDAVRHVGVDAPDQRTWIREWVIAHQCTLTLGAYRRSLDRITALAVVW